MKSCNLTIDVQPTSKYQKAKKDLIVAINSYEELAPQEKELLICEFFGAEKVAFLQSILTQTGR